MRHWRIFLDAGGRTSKVECDGAPVPGVTAVEIKGAVGKPPTVTVTVLARSVEVEAIEPEKATDEP